MATALFYNVPARGHVNPTLPVVSALTAAGDRIHYYASIGYRRAIEASGAVFHAYAEVPDDYFPAYGLTGADPVRTATELARTAAQLVPDLIDEARAINADFVITDSLCCWGWLVARALRLPLVVSHTFLLLTPEVIARRPRMAHVVVSLASGLGRLATFRRIWRPLARRYGVRPLRLEQFFSVPGDYAVNYTAAVLQPAYRHVRKAASFVGPSVAERVDDPEFPWEQLDGRPLIFASLGTINNDDPEFFRTCVAAFGVEPVNLVLAVGNQLDPSSIHVRWDNVIVRSAVPQLALLARADVFITHAGMNSVQEALLNGVPLLAVPRQPEQRCVAERVVELGAGRMLLRREVSAVRLRTEVAQLMTVPTYRARARGLAAELATGGGPQLAARYIRHFIGQAARSGPAASPTRPTGGVG